MLSRGATAKVFSRNQNRSPTITRLVQNKGRIKFAIRQKAPVVEQKLAKAGAFNPLKKLLRNDLISVDVRPIKRGNCTLVIAKGFHDTYLNFHCLTSVKCPVMAAAAAIIGLTRCVRPPRPCRPSKLRLLVEAQRSPGCRISAFMPRHIEQPASRHSKPESRKMRSRPSLSAARFTACEPGTTIALTELLVRYPLTMRAAARRSSMRALVHEPIKTRSI